MEIKVKGPQLLSIRAKDGVKKYKTGSKMTIQAKYDRNVLGNEAKEQITAETAPEMKLQFNNGTERTATFESSLNETITYSYTLQEGDNGNITITSYRGTVYDINGNTEAVNREDLAFDNIQGDTVLPTCRIVANPSGITDSDSVTYTITFSEKVTGFDIDDIIVENGTKVDFEGSGKVYTIVVTNDGDCIQKVSVAAGVCTDIAGNENEASNVSTVEIKKTVTPEPQPEPQPDPTPNSGENEPNIKDENSNNNKQNNNSGNGEINPKGTKTLKQSDSSTNEKKELPHAGYYHIIWIGIILFTIIAVISYKKSKTE